MKYSDKKGNTRKTGKDKNPGANKIKRPGTTHKPKGIPNG